MIENNRMAQLLAQISLFKKRLNRCVHAHIALYIAFILEMLGFGWILFS